MFISNKNRTVKPGQKVKVYYNLHKNLFSIKDARENVVLGYATTVQLENVLFKVSEAGRQRVLKEKRKNVHAYVVGEFVGTDAGAEANHATYNPHLFSSFVTKAEKQPLYTAKSCTCHQKQVMYA